MTIEEIDAEAARLAEYAKGRLTQSIGYYQKHIAEYEKERDGAEAKAQALVAMKAKLKAAGFECFIADWDMTVNVDIEEAQIPAVYEIVGRLKGEEAEKEIVDAKKRLVRVTVEPADYPFVRVSYQTKLAKNAKCRIETIRHKATREKKLVCSL